MIQPLKLSVSCNKVRILLMWQSSNSVDLLIINDGWVISQEIDGDN